MNWLRVFVIVIRLVNYISGSGFSKLDSALRYERCVTSKLARSPFFTEEDRLQMNKVILETGVRMQKLGLDSDNDNNTRTMLRLFSASLANLVNSVFPKAERKQSYISTLELCSPFLSKPLGFELVTEISKIFDLMKGKNSLIDVDINKTPSSKSNENNLEKISGLTYSEESLIITRSKRSLLTVSSVVPQSSTNSLLERMITNVLLNSPVFVNTFKLGLGQPDVNYYISSMIEAGLSRYSYAIIDETQNAIAKALTTMPMPNTADYAFAISKSIALVLGVHNLGFYADGSNIGRNLITKLQDMVDSENPSVPFSSGIFSEMSGSEWRSDSPMTSSQVKIAAPAELNPSPVEVPGIFSAVSSMENNSDQFQNMLSYFLSTSDRISNAFCSTSLPDVFSAVNSALSDKGFLLSIEAASAVSDSFTKISSDSICSEYATIISRDITSILQKNDMIKSSDSEIIVNKLESSLSSSLNTEYPMNNKNFEQQTFIDGSSGLRLNPSFTSEFDSLAAPQLPVLNPPLPVPPFSTIQAGKAQINSYTYPETLKQSVTLNQPSESFPTMVDVSGTFESGEPIKVDLTGSSSLAGPAPNLPETATVIETDQLTKSSQEFISSVVLNIGKDQVSVSTTQDPLPDLIPENGSMTMDDKSSFSEELNAASKASVVSEAEIVIETSTTGTPIEILSIGVIESSETTTTDFPISSDILHATTLSSSEESIMSDVESSDVAEKSDKSPEPRAEEKSSLQSLDITASESEKEQTSNADGKSEENKGDVSKSNEDESLPGNSENVQKQDTTISNSDSSESSTTGTFNSNNSRIELQPSFWPTPKPIADGKSSGGTDEDSDDYFSPDPILMFAHYISSTASSSIAFIRSESFTPYELCNRLNEFSSLVELPPVNECTELALIDYLLHVLRTVTVIFRGV